MQLDFDIENIDRLRERYSFGTVTQALNIAIKRTTRKADVAVSRAVRTRYQIKAREVKKRLTVLHRWRGHNANALIYQGRRIGLINFGARETRQVMKGGLRRNSKGRFTGGWDENATSRSVETRYTTRVEKGRRLSGGRSRVLSDKRKQRYGISVEVKKGRRKVIKPQDDILPFIATGRNGLPHIFRRETKAAHPLERLSSLSVPQMVDQVDAYDLVYEVVERESGIEFDSAMRYLTEIK